MYANNERSLDLATEKLAKELHKTIIKKLFLKKGTLFWNQRQYLE